MSEKEFLMHVGMQFKLERTRQRLTQRELAAKAKLWQQTINSVENAQENSHILTYQRVAAALGKSLKEIL
ncbi:MAG: helix-turn-helix transcriptional regulator [Bacteroidetes bacterium]|nr:helix-turn-helix transcriptional regulator [Bacteroidota bacterium]